MTGSKVSRLKVLQLLSLIGRQFESLEFQFRSAAGYCGDSSEASNIEYWSSKVGEPESLNGMEGREFESSRIWKSSTSLKVGNVPSSKV